MTEFWILAILLLFPGLLILVPALLRPRIRIAEDLNERNLQIAREHLAELEKSRKDGNLGETEFDQAKAELEGNLLDDLRETTSKTLDGRPAILSLVLILVLVPLVVMLLYQKLGRPDILERLTSTAAASEMHHEGEAKMGELLAKLEEKLKLNPDNVEGWFILGRSYMAENNYEKAVWALAEVNNRKPDNPNILVALADALIMANKGSFTPRAEELLRKAQELDPNNAISYWLLGMAHFERSQFTQAIAQWRKAMPLMQDSPDSVRKIGDLIEEAKAKGGEDQGAPVATAAAPAQATATDIRVWVSLSPELAAKAAPTDRLFVMARATSGQPLPLAVAKHQVSELPLEVSLTDAMAMMPELKLSNFDQVLVQARIVKGNEPSARSGDLESEAKATTTKGQQGVELVIDKQVP